MRVAGLLFADDRIPWTLIGVAGLLFADDEYHGRLLELHGLLFADDEYHGRLLELLDSYSPTTNAPWTLMWSCYDSYSPTTNTMDAYWSCWTPIRRRRIPWTLIGVAGPYSPTTNTMDAHWSCWTPIRRRRIAMDAFSNTADAHTSCSDAYSISFKDPLAGSTFCWARLIYPVVWHQLHI